MHVCTGTALRRECDEIHQLELWSNPQSTKFSRERGTGALIWLRALETTSNPDIDCNRRGHFWCVPKWLLFTGKKRVGTPRPRALLGQEGEDD